MWDKRTTKRDVPGSSNAKKELRRYYFGPRRLAMALALSIDGLRKTYGSTVAVDDLSLDVAAGEIFGLIGPNGAGKTTVAECILGLRSQDAGSIRVLGMDPQANSKAFYRRVGAQLQNAALPDRLTVREAITLFRSFHSSTMDPDRLLQQWGLSDKQETQFKSLSGGQKQRLFVALSLIHEPDLVVLDEVSTGLDPEARTTIRQQLRTLRDDGTTILLVTHFMDEAESLCDRVALLDHGQCIALAPPEQLINQLEASYQVRFPVPPTFDPSALKQTNGVHDVKTVDGEVTVRGSDELLTTVVRHLTERGVVPERLHAERATLEDVFVQRTGDPADRPLTPTGDAHPVGR